MKKLLIATALAFALALVAALVVLVLEFREAENYNSGLQTAKSGDYETALTMLKPLAEKGHAGAQNTLGVMYRNGEGFPQDNVYAHMWFSIAASRGDEKAPKNRDSIAEKMTAEEIAEAEELARECVRKEFKGC